MGERANDQIKVIYKHYRKGMFILCTVSFMVGALVALIPGAL